MSVTTEPNTTGLAGQQERVEQIVSERARAASPKANDPTTLGRNLDAVMRIPVALKIVLGSVTMPIADLVKLGRGAVIPLDRRVGEPVDVVVNGQTVARGEIVVIDEVNSRFGISLTQIVDDSTKDSKK